MVQLEFEIIPAIIGFSVYMLYTFAHKAIQSRAQQRKKVDEATVATLKNPTGKLDEEVLAEDDFDAFQDESEDEPVPEPAMEPGAEPQPTVDLQFVSAKKQPDSAPTKPDPRPDRVWQPFLFLALVFLGVAIDRAALRSQLPTPTLSSTQHLQQTGELLRPDMQESVPVSPEADIDRNSMAADLDLAASPQHDASAAVAVHGGQLDNLAEARVDNELVADRVLTVTLTRQTMGEDDGDFVRSAYYGTLMVGSPPEPFTVVFDTGSGHLILPSTYCRSETCAVHKRYRRSASTSGADINYDGRVVQAGQMRDQISVSFGTGEVTGVFVEDIVCVDVSSSGAQGLNPLDMNASSINAALASEHPDAEVVSVGGQGEQPLAPGCVRLRMIAATELSEEPFKSFQFDGILGLGLDGLSQTPDFNFLGVVAQSVKQWGGGMPHAFGVFLANSEEEDSEIALGGWASKHLLEELSWGPILEPEMGHWIVPIRGLRVDDERLNFCDDGSCKAAVDTGTSLLAVPTAVFPEMYELMKYPAPLAGHCQGHGPLLHIELDHFTVTLGPKDYARLEPSNANYGPRFVEDEKEEDASEKANQRPVRTDLRCLPTLMTLDLPEPLGPKLFILGEPVLRKYYTVYDGQRKSVGFGRARHRPAPSREDLLVMAAENEQTSATSKMSKRSRPTMFDAFRWRKQMQSVRRSV